MKLATFENTPFEIQFSFHRLIKAMEEFVADEKKNDIKRAYFKSLLQEVDKVPGRLSNIKDEKELNTYAGLIKELLEIIFPIALSSNEIKAVSMPFQKIMFNYTDRFQRIIKESGGDYDIEIRNFNLHQYYIASCCIIMNHYFNTDFDLTQPLFVDLPDAKGIIHHYRILYNADFVELIPTERAIMLTKEDIERLQDNFDDLDLWIEKFPQNSWILKGFGVITLIDVTIESALSLLKENFLKAELQREPISGMLNQIFSSIFKLPNLRIGYTPLEIDKLVQAETRDIMALNSYLLNESDGSFCLSKKAYNELIVKQSYYSISDVEELMKDEDEREMCSLLYNKGIRSCLFSPVVLSSGVEGILEIVSDEKWALNSVNAQKLDSLMPIITETFERVKSDLLNHVEAIIQREFTTIHPSVYWKFLEEAGRNYVESVIDKNYIIEPISFTEVYPLYGEIDIKGSSKLRNDAIVKDLVTQINQLIKLFSTCLVKNRSLILEKHTLQLKAFLKQLEYEFYSGLEQSIQNYIKKEIHPFLIKEDYLFDKKCYNEYLKYIDFEFDIYYRYRKIFDSQVGRMNKEFSDLLDERQKVVQQVYPHYYERFKTDGVEHNIYIGNSICPERAFDFTYLQNLRLWQLQVMSELMCLHYRNNIQDSIAMDVTILIFVYDTSLAIQFRMDEKRFDIDGSYNTRYEIIKKRLDKACIKNSDTRIVQPKQITIAFVSRKDLEEYKSYIYYEQAIGILENDIEEFDIEELQGVSGLLGLRVSVNTNFDIDKLDYSNLMHNFLRSQYL